MLKTTYLRLRRSVVSLVSLAVFYLTAAAYAPCKPPTYGQINSLLLLYDITFTYTMLYGPPLLSSSLSPIVDGMDLRSTLFLSSVLAPTHF